MLRIVCYPNLGLPRNVRGMPPKLSEIRESADIDSADLAGAQQFLQFEMTLGRYRAMSRHCLNESYGVLRSIKENHIWQFVVPRHRESNLAKNAFIDVRHFASGVSDVQY